MKSIKAPTRGGLRRLAPLALCLGLCALGVAKPSQAACKLQGLEMPVTMKGWRAVATLGINGQEVPLIVDSGAFYSSLSHAAAQQLKMDVRLLPRGMEIHGIAGQDAHAGVATAERLKLLGGELPNIDFLVGGNDDLNGTMGLLGRNILSVADAEYDLAHGAVRLMLPSDDCAKSPMAYWAGKTPYSEIELLRHERGNKTPPIEAIASVNGQRMRVLFDTGALTAISLKAAKSVGATDMKSTGRVAGVGQGTVDSWTASVERFEIGGEVIRNVRLKVVDFAMDGFDMLLGIDFFLSHRIYVSKQQRRIFFTYNGGQVFALSDTEPKPAAVEAGASAALPDLGPDATASAFARRGAASMARQDFKAALADLNRACEMDPRGAEQHVLRAELHQRMGQALLALQDLDVALIAEPKHVEARLSRAMLRMALAKSDLAIQDLESLDRRLPPQAPQRLQMVQAYERLQRLPAALEQLNHWIAANPHDQALAENLNHRCWTRMRLNRELAQALADCDRAIDLDAEDGTYRDSRGWVYLRQGEWRKAITDFEQSLKRNPKSAWSLYGRGIARSKLGDGAAGKADLDAARRLQADIDDKAAEYQLAAGKLRTQASH